jgi:hypothetical protein
MVFSLQKHSVQISNPSCDSDSCFFPLGLTFWTRVDGGMITLTNLFDSTLQLVTLVEGNKNWFWKFRTLKKSKIMQTIKFDFIQ